MAFDEPTFTCAVERPADDVLVVVVAGELHVTTAPELRACLETLLDDAVAATVLDLAGVGFVDSTGLSVLLDALRRVEHAGGALALVISNPTVLRIFEITHVDVTFDIAPTRDEAIERARRAAPRGA